VWSDVSYQAPTTEPEEMGAEIPNLPQVNQPITAANRLLQTNPNPKTNSTDAIQATNPTISATRTREEQEATNLEDFDPSDDDGEIKMVKEVNADFSINDSNSGIGGAHATRIIEHNWFEGPPKFKVEWDSEQITWEDLCDLKEDHPRMMASYILKENVSRSKRSDRTQSWAKKVIGDLRRSAQRISRLNDYFLDNNEEVYKVRGIMNRKKKKRKWKPKSWTFKYGVQVPASVAMARKLHIDNGKNTAWIDALKSEMKELFNLECFDIKSFGFTPGDDYQRTMLTIIYDVKQDLRQKPRLAAVGHLVDPLDHSVYSCSQSRPEPTMW
jgi:hypothetical protein